jgi:nitroreductase
MLGAIKKRRSIRKFKKREVEQKKLDEILRAAMFSPSGMHLRPWQFIVVKEQGLKDKLAKATLWSGFARNAPVVLVIGANGMPLWVEDCSIAAEAVYLEATNQGLGTCFIQITGSKTLLKDSEEYVRKVINAPKWLRVLCLMPIGYPDEEKEEHGEEEFDRKKIHLEKWR